MPKLKFCLIIVIVLSCDVSTRKSSKFLNRCFFIPPQCPNKNITFHLYTRDTQEKPHQLDLNKPKTITRAKFAKNRPLIILIHGYTGDKDYSPNMQVRPAYFKKNEFNVVSVDYKNLVLEPCYPFAVTNLPTVANCTAQLLDFVMDRNIFSLESIHVIGFSLGAQTAGMVANYLKKGRKLKRITGLDPAKPLFVRAPNEGRLDANDAEFVE
jgi:pimeloyl-ACP methyl ester carboxylesterase